MGTTNFVHNDSSDPFEGPRINSRSKRAKDCQSVKREVVRVEEGAAL